MEPIPFEDVVTNLYRTIQDNFFSSYIFYGQIMISPLSYNGVIIESHLDEWHYSFSV